jgi:hypothetical protein
MFQVLNELSSYNRDDIFVTNIVIRSIASRLGLVRMHGYGVALMVDLEERGRSGLLSRNTITFLSYMLEAQEVEGANKGGLEEAHQS